ncbi:MAG: hypothetical protein KAH17_00050 [Bacteroidales bacterium]|nr:hypothetical protein [Bacteroidales bacterium]
MKTLHKQDLILQKILSNVELPKAPESMKSNILHEISSLSISAKQETRIPGLSVLITVALVLLICLIWTITSTTGLEWSVPGIQDISLQANFDKWLTQANQLFDSIFDISLTNNGKWKYYAVGGLILFWFYFLVNMVLDKLTKSNRNYSV